MSTSRLSADLNDIPSITHLPRQSSTIKPDAFIKQDSELKLRMTESPEKHTEENQESPNPEIKNNLLENFGLRKDKKSLFHFDIDNFDQVPENYEVSTGVLRKLEKKAKKFEDFSVKARENKGHSKGFTNEHLEIENIVQHPEFDKVDLVSQFISDLERPSLIKIEEIIKNAKNSFKEIEKEYVDFQKNQQSHCEEHEKKAMLLEGDEISPGAANREENEEYDEDHEELNNSKTLMDMEISSKLKKLMSSLKKSSGKPLKSEENLPSRKINSERIRFEKNFKHFIKKKKNSFMQRTSVSPEKKPTEPQIIQTKPVKKKLVEHISKGELDLIQFFFEDIPKADNNSVLKSDVSKYLLSNPNILELYNLNPKNLVIELNSFETSNHNGFNLKEFIQFLKLPRDLFFNKSEFSKETISSMKHSLITDLPNICLLNDEEIENMRNVFKELDRTGDLTVNRKLLISSFRKDLKISQYLPNPTVYLPKCDKVLILDRIFHQIEREEFYGEEINRKAKESISWQHFIAHFMTYKKVLFISRELFHKIKKKIDMKTIFDDQDLLDLSQDILNFFKEAFEGLEKSAENYVYLPDILKAIRNNQKFEFLSQENARRASEKFCLPNETISEVLKRMEKEADDHLDWDEFLEFFTRRGRPKYFIIDKEERQRVYKLVLDRVLPSKIHTKKFKTIKKKFCLEDNNDDNMYEDQEDEGDFKDSMQKENIRIEGYDSDPEYQLKQAKTQLLQESRYNKAKKVGFFGAMFKENIDRENFKITIPQPFAFHERDQNKPKNISQVRLEQSLVDKDKEELEILKIRPKPVPVPRNVKDKNLWSKISRNMEERRMEVKKHSKAMTLQNEKPFSFYFREKAKEGIKKKSKQQRAKFQFKANPIPWFSSLKMMIDPETKERERREKIERAANISLSLSRLPPRMAQYEQQRLEKEAELEQRKFYQDPNIFTFKPGVSGKIPDFKKLQSRFEAVLELKKQRNFVPTIPEAPRCSENTRNVKREYLDEENMMMSREVAKGNRKDPIEIARKMKMNKPKIQAAATLKWQAAYEKRKGEIEAKEREKEEQKMQELERKMKKEKMKQKVQYSNAIVDNTEELKKRKTEIINAHQRKMQDDVSSYLQWKRDMEERLEQKPLLLESVNKYMGGNPSNKYDSDQIAHLLEENNLEAFNEEERELIREMQNLKNQGYNLDDLHAA